MSRRSSIPAIVLLILIATIQVGNAEGIGPPDARSSVLKVGPGHPYTSIQMAVDEADPGDTIEVYSGTYAEKVNISGNISSKDHLTIKGISLPVLRTSGVDSAFYVDADNISISGFLIESTGANHVVVLRTSYSKISNIMVDGGGQERWGSGIEVLGEENVLSNIQVTGCGYGISVDSYSGGPSPVRYNLVNCSAFDNSNSGFNIGFYTYAIEAVLIGCSSYGNEVGFESSISKLRLTDCTAHHNQRAGFASNAGLLELSDCASYSNGLDGMTTYSDEIVVHDSSFYDNGDSGLRLFPDSSAIVDGCGICDNMDNGIEIGSYCTATIEGNLIANNTAIGLNIKVPLNASRIFSNDLIGNNAGSYQAWSPGTCDFYDRASSKGNYWSHRTAPDDNGDGIVDVPYNIPGNSSSMDLYPLTDRATTLQFPGGIPDPNATGVAPKVLDIDLNATEGDFFEAVLIAEDPDTQSKDLIWSISTDAVWLSLEGNRISGTPTRSGNYSLKVTVTDGRSSVTRDLPLIVRARTEPGVNDPPRISTLDYRTRTKVEALYELELNASDADGDDLKWYLNTNASFLHLSGSRLSGTPMLGDVGVYRVKITVTDGEGSDFILFMLEVYSAPPLLKDPIGIRVVSNATDGSTTFSVADLGEGITIVHAEWYVDGVYYGDMDVLELKLKEGEHTVLLRVKDENGAWYEASVTLGNEQDGPWDRWGTHILIALAVCAIIISIIVLAGVAIFVRRKLRSRKDGPSIEDEDHEAQYIIPIRSPFSEVRSGPIDALGKGEDALSSEIQALMIKAVETRVERRMRRERLAKKLRSKFRSGEIDRELYEELNRYVDSDMEE